MDEQLRNLLIHLALLGLIIFVFAAGVIKYTDPTMFWLRYYGKDVGTIVEGLHAAEGDVALPYAEIHPTHSYLFRFTDGKLRSVPPGLYLAQQRSDAGNVVWLAYQGYGKVSARSPDDLVVVPSNLTAPRIIDLAKSSHLITAERASSRCALGLFLRKETKLVLTAPPELRPLIAQNALVQQLEQNTAAPVTMTITIVRGDTTTGPTISAGVGVSSLACSLRSRLLPTFPSLTSLASLDEGVTIVLPPAAPGEDIKTAQAVIEALEEATR